MDKSSYFFAYNSHLAKWLKYDKGFDYITKALHPQTQKPFYLFEKTSELQNALVQYKQN